MCLKKKKKKEISFIQAEGLSAGSAVINASTIKYKNASALTSTLLDVSLKSPIVGTVSSDQIVEQTISFARTYFESAMRTYNEIRGSSFHAPNILQEILTNLNLGLSNLFGNQWKDIDKQIYSTKRKELYNNFLKTKPTEGQISEFKREYPKIEKGRTFALSTLVRTAYKLAKGWNLKKEKPDLFEGLMTLYNYCKDIAEHTEREKSAVALSLTLEKVEAHIQIVQDIVRWFLYHYYDCQIPSHAFMQFKQIFGSDYSPRSQ